MEIEYSYIYKDLKKKVLPPGEWIDEADEAFFDYKDIKCSVVRFFPEGKIGTLNGYCIIPKGHPWRNKKGIFDFENIDVHGGISYFSRDKIGFDASHGFDDIPSMMFIREKIFEDMKERGPWNELISQIFSSKYRNMEYMIEECKKLADAIILASK